MSAGAQAAVAGCAEGRRPGAGMSEATTIWHAYLAVTLDGKIARPDGSVDFLDGFSAEEAGSRRSSLASTRW